MLDLIRSLVWRADHFDRALSIQIALTPEETERRGVRFWLAHAGAHLGDSWLWTLIAAMLWWRAQQTDTSARTHQKRLIGAWLISAGSTAILVFAIKQLFQRTRPGTGVLLYGIGPDGHSFPSGHAARMTTIFAWGNLLLPGWGWLIGLTAIWTSWSRVALGIHYVGDVLAGVITGGVVGLISRALWHRQEKGRMG